MSQGRTPAGNLNAYFSILKKLMNTASMAKHFNQPLPAVPTFKKKKGGVKMPRFIKKSFFERSTVVLAVGGAWEAEDGEAEGRGKGAGSQRQKMYSGPCVC